MKLFGWVKRYADQEYKQENEVLNKGFSNLLATNEALGQLAITKNKQIRTAGNVINAILVKAGGSVTLTNDEVTAGAALPAYRMESVEGGVLIRLAHASEGDE